MKYLVLLLSAITIFGLSSCNNTDPGISTDVVNNSKSAGKAGKPGSVPAFYFEETEHDFGKIIIGEKVTFSFKFTNSGGSDLLIAKVSTSCGCTVGKYPETPIAPGEEGFIEATFDSKHKKGYQNKSITILANTEPNKTTLRVKAQVIQPQNN